MKDKQHRAQFSIEYAILIVIFVAALLGMAVYFQRSLSGKWRSFMDLIGHGRQYYYSGGGKVY